MQRSRTLAFSLDVERWLALLASHPAVRLLALDSAVAVAATRLPEPFHADLTDRFLVAQARELVLELGDGAGALHRLAGLGQAGLLHPPSAIGERLSHLQPSPGGQSLEGKEQQAAGLMPHRLGFERCRHMLQQHRQQGQEAIGAEGPGEGQQPEGIGELGRNQWQRHRQHEQPIGRGGGESRQPLTLTFREGTFHQPASGLGQGGAQGSRRQLDALPQLAAEAIGSSRTEQRQVAGDGGGGGGGSFGPGNAKI